MYIDISQILKFLISSLFDFILIIFYTYSYFSLSNESKLQTTAVLFALYILVAWFAGCFGLKPLIESIKYYGETIEDDIWNLLSMKSKIYNLLILINLALGIYFIIIIGPFFGSCYQYNKIPCMALQLIAFFVFLESCFIGLIVVLLMLICFCQQEQNYLYSMIHILQRYNPIPETASDTQCSVCLSYIDENFNKKWTSLPCKHRVHQDCLTRWFTYGQICPHCKRQILLSETSNLL